MIYEDLMSWTGHTLQVHGGTVEPGSSSATIALTLVDIPPIYIACKMISAGAVPTFERLMKANTISRIFFSPENTTLPVGYPNWVIFLVNIVRILVRVREVQRSASELAEHFSEVFVARLALWELETEQNRVLSRFVFKALLFKDRTEKVSLELALHDPTPVSADLRYGLMSCIERIDRLNSRRDDVKIYQAPQTEHESPGTDLDFSSIGARYGGVIGSKDWNEQWTCSSRMIALGNLSRKNRM